MMKQGMIKCECGNEFYFQSIRESVPCMKCGKMNPNNGEPCVEKAEMSNVDWHDYLYKNKIIFIDDEFDGEDTWLVYYEDEELTKRIDDIDQFIEDYKNKVKPENE